MVKGSRARIPFLAPLQNLPTSPRLTIPFRTLGQVSTSQTFSEMRSDHTLTNVAEGQLLLSPQGKDRSL